MINVSQMYDQQPSEQQRRIEGCEYGYGYSAVRVQANSLLYSLYGDFTLLLFTRNFVPPMSGGSSHLYTIGIRVCSLLSSIAQAVTLTTGSHFDRFLLLFEIGQQEVESPMLWTD